MRHLEQVIDELTAFGTTTTNIVYRQTLPYRGVGTPPAERPC